MKPTTLVAGVGNVFFGDDGFGVEVARRLSGVPLPDWVRVADFGIRGIHLAYELMDREYDLTILVDATPRDGEPGTVYLIEPDLSDVPDVSPTNAHGMHPEAVFSILKTLGGTPGRVLIVGCEPASVEARMGLSEAVAAAVPLAIDLIMDVLSREWNPDTIRSRPGQH